MDSRILRIEAIDGPQLAGENISDLIVVVALKAHAVVIQAQVAMGVDKAGVYPPACHIHDLLTRQRGDLAAHSGNLSLPDGKISLDGFGVDTVIDRCVF